MFQFLRGVALIAAVALDGGAALAEPAADSANYIMPGCRSFIAKTGENLFLNGLCVGMIDVLSTSSDLGVCHPADATTGQSVRVVVKYIDDRPARLNEVFKRMALEALQVAWPCKN